MFRFIVPALLLLLISQLTAFAAEVQRDKFFAAVSYILNENSEDKFFAAFSDKVSETTADEIRAHQVFLRKFSSKKFNPGGFNDLYREYIYQQWDGSDWGNLMLEKSSIDTMGSTWTWSTDELLFVNGTWTNSHRYVVVTEPYQGEITKILSSDSYIWVDNAWVHFSRIFYTYDGNFLTEIIMEIAVEENTFMPLQKYEYTYNDMGKVSSETVSNYDGVWFLDYRKLVDYDESGSIFELLESNWRDEQWKDSLRTKYVYNSEQYLEEATEFLYTNGIEAPYRRLVYEYDEAVPGLLNFEQEYYWLNNDWSHIYRKHYQYNEWLLLTGVTTEQNESGTSFEYKSRTVFEYNSAFLEIERLDQEFVSGNWLNKTRMLTLYTPSSNDDENLSLKDFDLFNNYPNPFNPSTTISYSVPTDTKVTLKIYNAAGEEVAILVDEFKNAGLHKINFTASGLASGIYFYQIQAGKSSETKKMILMK